MPFPANARLRVAEAPQGLELVQELLNTRPSGPVHDRRAELLGDGDAAHAWAAAVLAERGMPAPPIDDEEAAALRALRDGVVAVLEAQGGARTDAAARTADVELALHPSGVVGMGPADARDAVAGLVLGEILLAQARGDWPRLKLCALRPCGAAFFDRSRNVSARYHSAWCANAVNLRNSRARKRAEAE